jgi:hypothetical protein
MHFLCGRIQANVLSAFSELCIVIAVGREFHVEQLLSLLFNQPN